MQKYWFCFINTSCKIDGGEFALKYQPTEWTNYGVPVAKAEPIWKWKKKERNLDTANFQAVCSPVWCPIISHKILKYHRISLRHPRDMRDVRPSCLPLRKRNSPRPQAIAKGWIVTPAWPFPVVSTGLAYRVISRGLGFASVRRVSVRPKFAPRPSLPHCLTLPWRRSVGCAFCSCWASCFACTLACFRSSIFPLRSLAASLAWAFYSWQVWTRMSPHLLAGTSREAGEWVAV